MANSRSIAYWICTALVAFFILPGGVIYVMRVPQAAQGVNQLGFPTYFVVFLGVWKILGPIALLAPGSPALKNGPTRAYSSISVEPPSRPPPQGEPGGMLPPRCP